MTNLLPLEKTLCFNKCFVHLIPVADRTSSVFSQQAMFYTVSSKPTCAFNFNYLEYVSKLRELPGSELGSKQI